MAKRNALHGPGKLAEPMVHSCGRSFDQANTYAMHAKHCDGKPTQKKGRIAARAEGRGQPTHADADNELGRATVVRRFISGQEQLVVVCQGCDEIKTISIADAMQAALQEFMRRHEATAHA